MSKNVHKCACLYMYYNIVHFAFEKRPVIGNANNYNFAFILSIWLVHVSSLQQLILYFILKKNWSCNLQFFSELITTQLRDFHMVSLQVVFTLLIFLTMQSYMYMYKVYLILYLLCTCRPDTSYLKGQGNFSLVKGTSMRNL